MVSGGRGEASGDENDERLQPGRHGQQIITSDSESEGTEDDKAIVPPVPPLNRTKWKKGPPPNFNIEFSELSTTESRYKRSRTPQLDDVDEPDLLHEILISTQGN